MAEPTKIKNLNHSTTVTFIALTLVFRHNVFKTLSVFMNYLCTSAMYYCHQELMNLLLQMLGIWNTTFLLPGILARDWASFLLATFRTTSGFSSRYYTGCPIPAFFFGNSSTVQKMFLKIFLITPNFFWLYTMSRCQLGYFKYNTCLLTLLIINVVWHSVWKNDVCCDCKNLQYFSI